MENIFTDISCFFHLSMSRGVDFDHIDTGFIRNGFAGRAFAAGFAVDRMFAVQSLGENSGGSSLADAAGSDKQVCMGDSPRNYGIAQCPGNMLLTHHVGKTLRTPVPCGNLICHKNLPLTFHHLISCFQTVSPKHCPTWSETVW